MSIILVSNISIACTTDGASPAVTGALPGMAVAQPFQDMTLEVGDFSQYAFLEQPIFGNVYPLIDITETVVEHAFFGDIVAELPVLSTEILVSDPYSDGLTADIQGLEFEGQIDIEVVLSADIAFIPPVVGDISGGNHSPDIDADSVLPVLIFDAYGVDTVADYIEGNIQDLELDAQISLVEQVEWLIDLDIPTLEFEATDELGFVADMSFDGLEVDIAFDYSLEWSYVIDGPILDSTPADAPWVVEANLPLLEADVSMGSLLIEDDIPEFISDVYITTSAPCVVDAEVPVMLFECYSSTPLTLDATIPIWELNTYTGSPNAVSQWVEANLPLMGVTMAWHTFTMDAIITPFKSAQRTTGYIDGY